MGSNAVAQQHIECSAAEKSKLPVDCIDEFEQAFREAFESALTKFDSLGSYFGSGMSVGSVCEMLGEEIQSDRDFLTILGAPQDDQRLQILLKKKVGTAFGAWKKNGSAAGGEKKEKCNKPKDNPLPWSSIEAYPEWVVNQIENYAHAEPQDQAEARNLLERTLLQNPLCAASIKYDGTCFGKLDTGELVGRKQVLGKACEEYQHTSTAAAERCDVAALRCKLSEMLDTKLHGVCIWGELMCNPGFYDYHKRGLAAKWLCFGVVASLDVPVVASSDVPVVDVLPWVSQKLTLHGLSHSISSGGKLRLVLCPALRKLLTQVAGCDVVDEQFPGATHVEVVARAAARMSEGAEEGLVLAFTRNDGQASLRKWKNSAEGASVSKKHAQLLHDCYGLLQP